jgi:hypothetical protein
VSSLLRNALHGTIAVLVGVLVFAGYYLTMGPIENDHMAIVARARQVLLGEWPVRDFIDPGMPLTYLLSAAAARVAGATLLTETVLCIGLLAAEATIAFALVLHGTGSTVLAVAAALPTLAVPTRLYSATKVFCLIVAMAFGVRAARPAARGAVAMLGGWSGVAFLMRFDYGVYISLAAAVLLLASRHSWSMRARTIAVYVLCMTCVIVPWVIYVHLTQGLGEYVGSAIRFASAERARTAQGWPRGLLFYGLLAIPVATLVAWVMKRSVRVRPEIAFLAVLLLLCDIAFLRDAISSRVGDIVAMSSVVGALMLCLTLPKKLGLALPVAASVVFVAWGASRVRHEVGSLELAELAERWNRTTDLLERSDSELAGSGVLAAVARYIGHCTPRGERVLVSGFAPEIPVLAGRPFAGGLPSWLLGYYVVPADVRIVERHLARERVGAVVLLEGSDVFVRSWPSIAARLRESGLDEHPIRGGRPEYRIWVRHSPAIDAETGLPCIPMRTRMGSSPDTSRWPLTNSA